VARPSPPGIDRSDVRATPQNDDEEEKTQKPLADGIPFGGATCEQALEVFQAFAIGQRLSCNMYSEVTLPASTCLARFTANFAS